MLTASLSKKRNHIKIEEATSKFGVKISRTGFIELDEAAKADPDAALAEVVANIQHFSLGAAFTTTKSVGGEDVATGKLYEVLVS